MNNTIFYDFEVSDDIRRQQLYDGQLFAYSTRPSILGLVNFAKSMIEDAFGGTGSANRAEAYGGRALRGASRQIETSIHPSSRIEASLTKQYWTTWDATAKRHSSTCQECAVRQATIISQPALPLLGIRIATPGTRLQPVRSTGGCRFMKSRQTTRWHFIPAIGRNQSRIALLTTTITRGTNCIAANRSPRSSRMIPRPLPRATEALELDPQIRLICPVGGVILFSGAQMHSSVPNTSGVTRFSIDFRTIHLDDAIAKRGAPNIDSACTGTVMRDYLNGANLSRVPDNVIALYDDATTAGGELIYTPKNLSAEKEPTV